jgi:8-oxo-dGTP pyrophosphatase MutT (NUDIX family)
MTAVNSTDPTPLRDSATVILLRKVDGGPPELLLLRRHARSGFAASAWVFPGGVVDAADRALDPAHWEGLDLQAIAPVVGQGPEGTLGLYVAAVRETFEEAGLLLARAAHGGEVDVTDPGVVELRRGLAARSARPGDFAAWLVREDLVLDLGLLTPFSRWRTPAQEPKRYDTIFFLARAPEGQVAGADLVETTESRWLSAAAALAADDLPLIYPTVRTLQELATFDTIEALLAAAVDRPELRPVQPHIQVDADGRYVNILHPDEPGYPHHLYPDADR